MINTQNRIQPISLIETAVASAQLDLVFSLSSPGPTCTNYIIKYLGNLEIIYEFSENNLRDEVQIQKCSILFLTRFRKIMRPL
jgi:hypothetical protein